MGDNSNELSLKDQYELTISAFRERAATAGVEDLDKVSTPTLSWLLGVLERGDVEGGTDDDMLALHYLLEERRTPGRSRSRRSCSRGQPRQGHAQGRVHQLDHGVGRRLAQHRCYVSHRGAELHPRSAR